MPSPSLTPGSRLVGLAAIVLAGHGAALACSGRGAGEAILRAERLGWSLWFATLVLAGGAAFILRSGGWRRRWPLLLLVVLHPGWWMSARSGDCGHTLVLGSIVLTAVTPLVVGLLVWRARRAIGANPSREGNGADVRPPAPAPPGKRQETR